MRAGPEPNHKIIFILMISISVVKSDGGISRDFESADLVEVAVVAVIIDLK